MNDEQKAPEKEKRNIERSASYPGIGIEDAIPFVSTINKHFPSQNIISRGDISAVTKIKTVHRMTAAAVQYGMLERAKAKDGYLVSHRFKEFLNPVSKEEERKMLVDFFKSPKLYADLIEKYNEHVIPTEFKSILVRFHKIANAVAEEVADLFSENARFVGVLSESNILKLDATPNQEPLSNPAQETNKHEPKKHEPVVDTLYKPQEQGQDEVRVPLTESKSLFIRYPKNMNEKDILVFKKWIEVLELTL